MKFLGTVSSYRQREQMSAKEEIQQDCLWRGHARKSPTQKTSPVTATPPRTASGIRRPRATARSTGRGVAAGGREDAKEEVAGTDERGSADHPAGAPKIAPPKARRIQR